jgi:hypothetical protein
VLKKEECAAPSPKETNGTNPYEPGGVFHRYYQEIKKLKILEKQVHVFICTPFGSSYLKFPP